MAAPVASPAPAQPETRARAAIPDRTLRQDRWWLAPGITLVVLTAFVAYSTWAAFQNANYYAKPYLSPFYSPCVATVCGKSGAPVRRHRRAVVGHLTGHPGPDLPARVPAHLLLLPPGLLPRVLAVAAGLRRRRAAPALHAARPASR